MQNRNLLSKIILTLEKIVNNILNNRDNKKYLTIKKVNNDFFPIRFKIL
jgi:hypothetical protein